MSLEEIDALLCSAAGEALPLGHLDPTNSAEERAKVEADPRYDPVFVYAPQDKEKLSSLCGRLAALELPGFGVGVFFRQARDYLHARLSHRLHLGVDDQWQHQLYPAAPDRILELARRILSQPLAQGRAVERPFRATDQVRMVNGRLRQYGLLDWRVEVRPNLAATNTDPANRVINLRADLQASMEEMKRLVVHEIDTHVLRAANGYHQPYQIFAVGAVPSYMMTEEGLAVVNEERMGYIDAGQVEKLAAPMKKNGYGHYLLSLIAPDAPRHA